MTLEQTLYSYLTNHAGLKALVGTRVYPVLMPQDPTLPAVTYQKVSNVTEYVLDGTSVKRVRVQLDAWATSYSSAKAVGEQIKAALDRFAGTMGTVEIIGTWLENETDMYEPGAGIYRVSIDARIEHK